MNGYKCYLVGLSYPVCSGEGLDVIMRVPIRIVDDDSVGCSQVDPETSSPKIK